MSGKNNGVAIQLQTLEKRTLQWNPFCEATLTRGQPSGKATRHFKSKHKCIDFYPWRETTPLERLHFCCKRGGLTRGVPLYIIYLLL